MAPLRHVRLHACPCLLQRLAWAKIHLWRFYSAIPCRDNTIIYPVTTYRQLSHVPQTRPIILTILLHIAEDTASQAKSPIRLAAGVNGET